MHNIGVIGFGYWGPNIVRNFSMHPECEVKYICDFDKNAQNRAKFQFPGIKVIDDTNTIFTDNEIDIVAIVTPVSTHYPLAKKALETGKHIFLEKPMVETVDQADTLIQIAEEKNLVSVVDHTFLFTSAVKKIKEIVYSGEIGEITYFDSVRVNLGLFQHDVNVIWDLCPHDLAILFYITDERPISLTANGVDHLDNGHVDVAYLTLHYESKLISNFHVNWLSPVKVRKILIGGSKKMIVFDDMEPSEKIKVYNKGVEVSKPSEIRHLLFQYRSGDMFAPNLSNKEALQSEINDFIERIRSSNESSCNSLIHGREVVKILEASNQSLKRKGKVFV